MTFPNNSVIAASGWNKQNIYLSIYGEPHEWGGSIKKPLPSSKEYLRGDYKVKLKFCTIYEKTYRVYTQVLQKIYITSTWNP